MALTKVKNVIDITADTMADLLSMQHKKGSVQLLGFHERGDGGGGVFFWDADKSQSEHNGGTIIAGDAVLGTWDTAGQEAWFTAPSVGTGCWVREYSGAVNVKWFGAKGDGVTDDTLSITTSLTTGTAIGNDFYETTFSNIPAGLVGNGAINLDSPARTENISSSGHVTDSRVSPAGFSFVPNNALTVSEPGQTQHGIDVLQLFEDDWSLYFGGTEIWVDPVLGNDVSTGSVFAPKKTVKAAYQVPAVGTVRLKEGVYTDPFFLEFSDNTTGGGTVARPIRVIGLGNVVFRAPGDQPSSLTWVLDATYSAATYSATPIGTETANAIIWNHGGEELLLPYYSVGGDLASVSLGWFQDAGTKQIHIKLGGYNVETDKASLEVMYSRGASVGLSGANTYIENITFRGDTSFIAKYDASNHRPALYQKDVVFEYSETMGLRTEGAKVYSQNVVSRNNFNGDGFNYYNQYGTPGGQVTEAVEIDCIAHSNGIPINNLDAGDPSVPSRTWDGTRNKQGSSGHDDSVICRINGEYYNNFGQNIADTGTGSRTWMIGSVVKDVYAELWNTGVYPGYINLWTEGTAYLDTVYSGGKTITYAFYNQSGTSKHFNQRYSGTTQDYVLNSGSITNYLPKKA